MNSNPAYNSAITAVKHPLPWQSELARGIRDAGELCRHLTLPEGIFSDIDLKNPFPIRVPLGFVSRMRPGDPDDPLLRQVLPRICEEEQVIGFSTDPVGDMAALKRPGLLHKYRGRALVMTTGACAIHCRYCFRRHFPYQDETPHGDDWSSLLKLVREDGSIREIILSGGDPLMVPDARLSTLVSDLLAIDHVARIRFHTRLPIVLPERIDQNFMAWFSLLGRKAVVVVHCNHPNEIDTEVEAALERLGRTGSILMNQAVLLRGVNDRTEILAALSERLFELGVLPYYLHQLDRVRGAAHFEVPRDEARALYRELHASLPGYLVPRLVEEIPGEPGKTLISLW
ncbi:MAG: EF-P beta-lysylation protein EpmB [Gammaproteobacteria bacterium]|nr:EF-P beta-lysylation protein EpmB [Gammaproteobacteria bacterium]